jgi:hypothetical protein
MSAVLAIALVGAAVWLMKGRISSARAESRDRAGKPAKAPRSTLLGHWLDGRARYHKAQLDDWLEERRQGRKSGTHTAPPAPPKQTVRGNIVPDGPGPGPSAPAAPRAVPPQGRQSPPPGARMFPGPAAAVPPSAPAGPPANGSGPQRQQPSSPAGSAPAQPQSPNPQPSGGSPVSNPVEQMVEGINAIRAEAMSGGIHAKHRAIKAAVEGGERFAALMTSLSRELSEPGMHYGPEITEPLSRMGQFFGAGAATGSEADASMASLKNTTLGDLAQSARQAPDHSELSEAKGNVFANPKSES